MKNLRFFIMTLILSFVFVLPVSAKEVSNITLYLFYGDGCPHCASEKEFLSAIENKYENLDIVQYEVWYNNDNQRLLSDVKEQLDIATNGVPVTVIGEKVIVGWSKASEEKLENIIESFQEEKYEDVVVQIENGTYVKSESDMNEVNDEEDDIVVSVPLVGNINLKGVSLTTAAFILGLIDGFNPCAMWVLLFLISMLIGMKDKKRMWTIGLTFLGSSALVYMLIMMSWLNIVVDISASILMRNIVAIIAIGGGIVNLYSFFKHKDGGCSVVDEKKRKSVFARIKKFTSEKSLFLALIGAVALAFSVNIIELACSAGLPLVYTQLLAINNITGIGAFFYVLIYIICFLLDDLIVFFLAMKTMEVTGISTKYGKYSHLIGGILMIVISILLIFRPEWLMFQFN